jgi:Heparinase II/III-like protein/Heparinase II/III N-terminus
LRISVRHGLSLWRRLGLRRGARGAARYGTALARGFLRDARVRRRPPYASAADVAAALGGVDPVAALRGTALSALPTVAAFKRALEGVDGEGGAALLARAEDALAHRFDLLGSGPLELGPQIDWLADHRTGRRWPLRHGSLLPAGYGAGSDIRVVWELSRFHHLPLLAAAHRITGDRRFLNEIGGQLGGWIDANPVERGPNWASTMEVGIRAMNWVATLVLVAEAGREEPWFERVLGSLLQHGRFIRSNLEDGEPRANHYLANVVGLLPVAAVFFAGEGRAWAEWAASELEAQLASQVHPDGTDFEASIPYHRLVTEFFVCGSQAVDGLLPGRLSSAFATGLDSMLRFVADYIRPDGLAPQVGDGDDGRLLPLDDHGVLDPRDHRHLFRQAGRNVDARGSVAYPDGGWYVLRGAAAYVLVHCGGTGRNGVGGHGHNDHLSFELAAFGRPLVIDPGAYAYTSDPAARNLFRSTGFHSTLRVGGAEQNELRTDDLFLMPDRSRAEAILWEPSSGGAVFEGRHHGFEVLDPPALHIRRLELDGAARTLAIRDAVESGGSYELEWAFPLAPCETRKTPDGILARFDGVDAWIESDVELRVEDGYYSPRFGVRLPTPFVRATKQSRPGRDETTITIRFEQAVTPATRARGTPPRAAAPRPPT